MPYMTNLDWVKNLSKFTPNQQKILLALSDDRYTWRARERLVEVTGLPPTDLDSQLAQLIAEGWVRPSFSKERNIIYGLKQRIASSQGERYAPDH